MFVLVIGPHTQSPVCLLFANCKTVKSRKSQRSNGNNNTTVLEHIAVNFCFFCICDFHFVFLSFSFVVFLSFLSFCLFVHTSLSTHV